MTVRARRWISAGALLLAVACDPATDRPDALQGEWLVDLSSVDCSAEPLVSQSGDGRWLAFWVSYFRPDAGLDRPVNSPALIDWAERELVLPAGPADRVSGPSFDTSSLCWDDPGRRLFVRATGRTGSGTGGWFHAELESAAELVAASSAPDHCRRPATQQVQWHRRPADRSPAQRGLEIVQTGCCTLELRDADGRLLAAHETTRTLSDQLLVARFAWSESGRFLAYTLSEQTRWRFARPAPTFVLAPGRTPQALDGRVFALAWRDDAHLFGCTARDNGNGLKLWRVDHD